jgi:EH signature protein
MTSNSWIDALRGQVAGASARSDSMFAKLHDERRQLGAQMDKLLDRLGNAAVAREAKVDSHLHERVLDAIRTGRSQTLSPREQRYGAKLFEHVSPDQMKALLHAQPSCWQRFATECFRRWEVLDETPDRTGYARLLCLAPSSVSFLHQAGRPQDLVTRDAPATVAKLVPGNDLVQARLALYQRGFDPSWSFTATVLAMSLRLRASQRGLFGTTWESLKRDLVSETMLLPRMPDRKQSWFAEQPRPARIRGSTVASAIVVATLIRAAYASEVDPVHRSEFTEKLLSSEFKDPRVPPESTGWAKTRTYDAPAYLRFLESLISDDLEIFFAHAMTDVRRENFWLRYLSSIRRTVCILDRSAYARLRATLAGADKKMAAALSRAKQFTTRGGASSAQAFCLYFDSVVIVEFSETGNAMYIYDRRVFEEQFQADIYSNRCSGHAGLKVQRIAKERLVHTHANWEAETRAALNRMGISPDTAKSA